MCLVPHRHRFIPERAFCLLKPSDIPQTSPLSTLWPDQKGDAKKGNQWIDQPLGAHELTALRTCVNRQQPFGTPE